MKSNNGSAPLLLSVVITADPCFDVMTSFFKGCNFFDSFNGFSIEVVVVDDLNVLSGVEEGVINSLFDGKVTFLKPKSRLGQLDAIFWGMRSASGDAILVMDPDMYSCLDMIDDFIGCFVGGAQIVYTNRVSRRGVSLVRRRLTDLFNFMVRVVSGVPLSDFNTNMILYSKEAASLMLAADEGLVGSRRIFAVKKMMPNVMELKISVAEVGKKKSNYSFFSLLGIGLARFREVISYRVLSCKHKF